MTIELTKQDLIHLLKGTTPNYNVMDSPFVKANGSYTGGFKDEWNWNYDCGEKMTEQQIWDTYVLCRDSFKK